MKDEIKQILEIVMETRDEVTDIRNVLTQTREEMATKKDLEHFASKDDLNELRQDLNNFRRSTTEEFAAVHRRLDTQKGLTKEIDYVMGEIKNIKDYVGMPA